MGAHSLNLQYHLYPEKEKYSLAWEQTGGENRRQFSDSREREGGGNRGWGGVSAKFLLFEKRLGLSLRARQQPICPHENAGNT